MAKWEVLVLIYVPMWVEEDESIHWEIIIYENCLASVGSLGDSNRFISAVGHPLSAKIISSSTPIIPLQVE